MSGTLPSDVPGPNPQMPPEVQGGPGGDRSKVHAREAPNPPEQRRQLVNQWIDRIVNARDFWKHSFDRMRDNMRFTYGTQWPRTTGADPRYRDERYVANVTLRHVLSRTAELYASNPKVVAQRRERMMNTVWDGQPDTLANALNSIQQAQQAAAMLGQPPMPDPNALAIVQDAKNVETYNKLMDRVSKTLTLFYQYNIDEQLHPFKVMMKDVIRRSIITAVGYVKVGFQRALAINPEIERNIADMTQQLANVERLAADIADKEADTQSAVAEELRLALRNLEQQPEIIAREGLTFDYPDTWSIIPDPKCRSLRSWLGAEWVCEEFLLLPEQVQEIYKVDIGRSFRAWSKDGKPQYTPQSPLNHLVPGGTAGQDPTQKSYAMVWEVYNRKDGNVYIVCDGWPDFLREPVAPNPVLDRFYPWFAIVINEGYAENTPYPPSDVDLMRDPQLEINRARQGLREHRRANRPKIAVAAGVLEQEDTDKLRNHPANAVLELNALAPGQKIEDVLQPVKMPPIDPALYDTNSSFEDVLRVVGTSQPDMGETPASATATETASADAARHTDIQSVIDDLDDFLSELARAGGQILLENVSQDTVVSVLGPGAAWPQLDIKTIVENVYLEVEAGSTGRPNKQQEVQNMGILVPLLQRIPGISPVWLAQQVLRRLDDRLDVNDAIIEGIPSMEALNRAGTGAGPGAMMPVPPHQGPPGVGPHPPAGGGQPGAGPKAPSQQGAQGLHNDQAGPPMNGTVAPRMPGLSPNPASEATAAGGPRAMDLRGPLGVVPRGPDAGGPTP